MNNVLKEGSIVHSNKPIYMTVQNHFGFSNLFRMRGDFTLMSRYKDPFETNEFSGWWCNHNASQIEFQIPSGSIKEMQVLKW